MADGYCSETACVAQVPDTYDNRCGGNRDGGPSGHGCGELFCDRHLFVTDLDGSLCAEDAHGVEAR